MKRFLLIALLFAGTINSPLLSAPRTNPQEQTEQPSKPTDELSDEERDAMLITSGMGILGAVVSIFIDRHNLPHVKTQLFALLAGLQQFVSYMVRSPLSPEQEKKIVEELLAYLENQWEINNLS